MLVGAIEEFPSIIFEIGRIDRFLPRDVLGVVREGRLQLANYAVAEPCGVRRTDLLQEQKPANCRRPTPKLWTDPPRKSATGRSLLSRWSHSLQFTTPDLNRRHNVMSDCTICPLSDESRQLS